MKECVLVNKRILLISVKFFNYECLIKKQLEEMGGIVDLFDERPSNSFFSKAIIRIKKDVYARKINTYFREIIEQIKYHKYHYFLLIKGEATPQFFINFLKKNNAGIKLIFYTYDSFKNNSNGLAILDNFDYKYTFDSDDAIKYNIGFRPLFFANDYKELYTIKDETLYDLAFIGTAHSDRYLIAEMVKNWCIQRKLRMFTFYYSPSKILFRTKKLIDKSFKNFDYNKISFDSLSHKKIIDIYRHSKVILDINHPGQRGLTMRTFEALGAGKKLITTNSSIIFYPFYSNENILVIDRDNIELNYDFFMSPFKDISSDIYESMSLKGWVENVFGLNDLTPWRAREIDLS